VGFSVVLLATFLILIDITIVNVAIPSIQKGLHTGYAEIELVVAGYQLAYAVGLITGGRLGDLYGRRRMLVLGLGGFAAASLCAGASVNGAMLVGSRIAQGLAAALLYPQVLSLIQVIFPPARRGRAFGLQGAVVGLAVASGPLLGGLLIQWNLFGLDWRAIFLVNLPVAAVAIPAALLLIEESRGPRRVELDLGGVAIVTAGLASFVLPLTAGHELGWPSWLLGILAASAPLLAGFVLWERHRTRRKRQTLVELSLLGNLPFVSGLAATMAFYATLPSFSFTLSIFLQRGLGLSPLATGLVFVSFAAGLLAGTFPASRLGDLAGKWAPMAGCGLMVLGFGGVLAALHAAGRSVNGYELAPGLFFVGAGVRTVITPLFTLVLAATVEEETGSASGVLSTVQRLGGAAGVALVGLIFFGLWAAGPVIAFESALVFNLSAAVLTAALLVLLPRGRPEELAQGREKAA
jgi:MFS family permease